MVSPRVTVGAEVFQSDVTEEDRARDSGSDGNIEQGPPAQERTRVSQMKMEEGDEGDVDDQDELETRLKLCHAKRGRRALPARRANIAVRAVDPAHKPAIWDGEIAPRLGKCSRRRSAESPWESLDRDAARQRRRRQ